MSAYLIKLVSVLLWSAFKYLVGFFIAIGSPPHFGFFETVITNVGGGMLGVIAYLYVWEYWVALWKKWKKPDTIEGVRMTKRKRWIVKFIARYEIYGIIILTPLILTPPLGTVLAAMVEPNKWKIKIYMLIAFLSWTIIFYMLYEVFGIKLDEVVGNLFK
jgi:hypothetical protein